jgi:hypothetical protein
VTGRDIDYVDVPEEAARAGMLAAGMPPPAVDGLLSLFAANKAGRTAAVTGSVQELTGHAPRDFREFARDHAEAWRQG